MIGIFIVEHKLFKGLFDTCELEKPKRFFRLNSAIDFVEKTSGRKVLRSHLGFSATKTIEGQEYGNFESWTIRSPFIFDILGIGLGS